MKKFSVVIPVKGTAFYIVEAESAEDAKKKALEDLDGNGTKYAEGVDCGLDKRREIDIEVHDG